MAYVAGDIIAAEDLNGFINVLDNIWTVGYATRGYGQTGAFPTVQPGDIINGAAWANLIPRISTISLHQSGAVDPEIPIAVDFNTGEIIEAKTSSGSDLPKSLTTIDTNRVIAHSTSTAIMVAENNMAQPISSVRTASWGDVVPQLVHEFTVNFSIDNTARYFFNSGGQIIITASRTGGANTPQNAAWTNLLANMGQITFGYATTTISGFPSQQPGAGFYNIVYNTQNPTAFQEIARVQGSSYGMYDYYVKARVNQPSGLNGGNGNQITFRIEFNNNAPFGGDQVTGTLSSNISFRKAIPPLLSITSPVFVLVTPIV